MNIKNRNPESGASVWKTLILLLAVLVNISLLIRLVWGPQSIVSYRELVAQHTELTNDIARIDTVNAALSREIRLLQSDEKYLEKMIRQRLNFVRGNEILYLFENEQNQTGAATNGKKR